MRIGLLRGAQGSSGDGWAETHVSGHLFFLFSAPSEVNAFGITPYLLHNPFTHSRTTRAQCVHISDV